MQEEPGLSFFSPQVSLQLFTLSLLLVALLSHALSLSKTSCSHVQGCVDVCALSQMEAGGILKDTS